MDLKSQIINANDTPLEPMQVEQWGATIYLPIMSIADVESLRRISEREEDDAAAGAAMLVRIVRDQDGNRVFSDDDAKALEKKSAKVVNAIIERFNTINGIGQEAQDEAVGKPTSPTSASG